MKYDLAGLVKKLSKGKSTMQVIIDLVVHDNVVEDSPACTLRTVNPGSQGDHHNPYMHGIPARLIMARVKNL